MENPNRMTGEELEALKPTPYNMVTLICDDGYYKDTYEEIKVFAVFENRFYFVNKSGASDWFYIEDLEHFPSFKKPQTAYYFWRFWFKDGEIENCQYAISEDGLYADGNRYRWFDNIIKKEKISEAIYKVEGQE